ncbi:cytochrome c oxidase subunit 6C-like [Haematobia irritans]|uniref:cytochrome c oxidase subunit 6C-like n=1 Tax=Haematobia irritans TaxID=7368 RepID=UPI003F4F89E3
MTKPQFPMHHCHFYKSVKQICFGLVLSLSASTACYLLHNLPRKQKYANFYSTYDPMASFLRMKEGGYLDSCPPSSTPKALNNKK